MVKPTPSNKRTVVLIEDDVFIAAALRDMLEFNGYEVVVATSLRAVSAALGRARGPSLVLLDPLVSGISAAGVLRALGDGQALITVAVAVYPPVGGRPPSKPERGRRLVSPDLLLEMIRESFGAREGDLEARLPLAA